MVEFVPFTLDTPQGEKMYFRKLIAALTMVISFNTFATAPINHMGQLKTAFDQLNFSLQVEWDQKDKKFYNSKVKEFHDQITNLQKQGLKNAEILEFIKRNIKDQNIASDIDELYETIKVSDMSAKEARKFALEHVSSNYAQGANWAGSASAAITLAALILVLAILVAASTPTYTSYPTTPTTTCYDEYVCEEYYDYYYNVWYEDCWWETYCY